MIRLARINKELNQIKNAVYGREVRSSIHDGIDKINNETEKSTELSEETESRQISLENQFEEHIKNMTLEDPSSAEIVSARTAKDGTTYDTLKERLDYTIVVSKTEPKAEYWYEDMGETPIEFDPGQAVMIANAVLNTRAPEDIEDLWFKT